QAVAAGTADWRKAVGDGGEDSNGVAAVLIGTCEQQPLEKLLESLQSWDKGLPILLLGDDTHADALPEPLRRAVIGTLAVPPTYNQLLDSLHRAQTYRDQFNQS